MALDTSERRPPCPVCKSDAILQVVRQRCALWECKTCGHSFSFVPPDAREQYDTAYHEEEERHGNWASNPDYALYDRVLKRIAAPLKPGARILDVGCGLGAFLRHAIQRYPDLEWQGIDYATCSVAAAHCIQGDFMTHDFGDLRFDAICSFAVIEHVEDPVAFVQRMRTLLVPGGFVAIMTVENNGLMFKFARLADSLGMTAAFNKLYFTHHFQHFTQNSLRRLLERQHLRVMDQFPTRFPCKAAGIPRTSLPMRTAYQVFIRLVSALSTLTGRHMLQALIARNDKNIDFDDFADEYKELLDGSLSASGEGAEYFGDYKARWVARLLGPDFQGRILDYGCGIGLLANPLSGYLPRAQIEGYDVSGDSVRLATAQNRENVQFFHDADKIRGPYDAILLANVLHHVPPGERDALMASLKRLLKPGGQIIIFEHNPLNPLTRRVVRSLPYDRDAVLLTRTESIRLIQSAGLTPDRRDYVVFFPHCLRFLRSVEPCLSGCPLGAQHIVTGVKHD